MPDPASYVPGRNDRLFSPPSPLELLSGHFCVCCELFPAYWGGIFPRGNGGTKCEVFGFMSTAWVSLGADSKLLLCCICSAIMLLKLL